MKNINLPYNLRGILRSYLSMDLNTTSDVAKNIGISRSTLTFALDGNRSIPNEALDKLYKHFGIVNFLPDPEVPHFLKVGADIDPLIKVINTIPSSKLSYIKPFGDFDNDEPFTGFFVFECSNNSLIVVHRDKMRSGKGVVRKEEEALPIKPDCFKNVTWSDNPEIKISREALDNLEAPFYYKSERLGLSNIKSILNIKNTNSVFNPNDLDECFSEYEFGENVTVEAMGPWSSQPDVENRIADYIRVVYLSFNDGNDSVKCSFHALYNLISNSVVGAHAYICDTGTEIGFHHKFNDGEFDTSDFEDGNWYVISSYDGTKLDGPYETEEMAENDINSIQELAGGSTYLHDAEQEVNPSRVKLGK